MYSLKSCHVLEIRVIILKGYIFCISGSAIYPLELHLFWIMTSENWKDRNAQYIPLPQCPIYSKVTCLSTTAFTRYIIRDPVVVDGADARRVVQDNPRLTLRTLTQ